MKQNIDISELLGKSIDADTLNLLMTEGRIKFPVKPVTAPSAISKGLENDACEKSGDPKTRDETIKNLIDNVKENEKLVKTLEDMRDDLIRDMAIPSTGNSANKLGAKNGIITKEIYDKAKTITDPDFVAISNWGYVPKLAALLGDGRILGKYSSCDEVTKAVFDGFNLAKNDKENGTITKFDAESNATTISNTEAAFENKMLEMFMFILNKLFWNHIWTRMWVGIFDMTEKLIAVPIDTPILIIKSLLKRPPKYKLSTDNYYRFGPVHRLLNRVKKLFLCKIPKGAWPPYMAETGVMVYINGKGMVSIAEICTDKGLADPCSDFNTEEAPLNDGGPEITQMEEMSDLDQIGGAVNKAFPNDPEDPGCPKSSLGSSFKNVKSGTDSVGTDMDCIAAAQDVLKRVYNDAMFNN